MTAYYAQGVYRCEVVDQGLSMSSTSKHQIWLRLKVLESIDWPDKPVEQYERTIYWTLTEKTIDFVVEKLELLGFSGQSFRDLDPNADTFQSFIGQQLDCYCKVETYEGKEREKWDLSKPLAKTPEPLGDADARKLDALFGRKLKERFRQAAQAAPKPAAAAVAADLTPPIDATDIPF